MKLIGAGLRVRPFFVSAFWRGVAMLWGGPSGPPFFFAAASPHQLPIGRRASRALSATRTGQHRGSCTSAARFDRHNRHAILAALPIPPVTYRASSLWGRNVTFWGSNNWQRCQYQLKSASAGLDTLRVSRFYQKLSTPKMLLFARLAVSHQLLIGRRASFAYFKTVFK